MPDILKKTMNGHTFAVFDNSGDLGDWYDKQYTAMGDGWVVPRSAALSYIEFAEILKDNDKGLLDVGSGAGYFIEVAQEYVRCVGIELSTVGLEFAKKRVPTASWLKMDVEDMTFRGKEFDYVTSIGSIEHVINIDKAIREIYRVLKDDGKFFVWVPNETWIFEDQPHEQTHTDEEWIEIFEREGFKKVKIERRGDNTAILFVKEL
jgi:cyclopropane fatty-acyl-phospholipid synthase-like methyltransferase